MTKQLINEYRPGRNFIRVGDTVKCAPLSGNRFKATVRKIVTDADTGKVVEVEVARQGDYRQIRTFRPERVTRVAQSRVEVRA